MNTTHPILACVATVLLFLWFYPTALAQPRPLAPEPVAQSKAPDLVEKEQFKLTGRALDSLRRAGMPDAIRKKLDPLKNKELFRDEFLAQINSLLSKDESVRFRDLILNKVKREEFADCGGQFLPYHLPDLLLYVDGDMQNVLDSIDYAKSAEEKALKAWMAKLMELLPAHSELGCVLSREKDDQGRLEQLEMKTVSFSPVANNANFLKAINSLTSGALKAECAQVKKIDISYTKITGDMFVVTAEVLAYLENEKGVPRTVLVKLASLKDREFNNDSLRLELVLMLFGLEKLHIDDILKSANVHIISRLSKLINLTDLDISATEVLTGEGFNDLTRCLGQIRRLWLRGTTIAGYNLEPLLNSLSAELKFLSLADLTVASVGNPSGKGKLRDQHIEQLNRLGGLQGLDLANNSEITDGGLKRLTHSSLKWLSLSGTGRPKRGNAAVTDAGVIDLLIRNQNKLSYLNLSGTTTAATPKSPVLEVIRRMRRLEVLNLAGTGICDGGLISIWKVDNKEKSPLGSLLSLDISDTSVTDAGFIDIAGNVGFPRLKNIYIGASDLKVTSGGISRRNALLADTFTKSWRFVVLTAAGFPKSFDFPALVAGVFPEPFNLAKLQKATQ